MEKLNPIFAIIVYILSPLLKGVCQTNLKINPNKRNTLLWNASEGQEHMVLHASFNLAI